MWIVSERWKNINRIYNGVKRKDQKIIRYGCICHFVNDKGVECQHIVQNLRHHLREVHKLSSCSSMFEELIARSATEKPLKRKAELTMPGDNFVKTLNNSADNSSQTLMLPNSSFSLNSDTFPVERGLFESSTCIYDVSTDFDSDSDSNSNILKDAIVVTKNADPISLLNPSITNFQGFSDIDGHSPFIPEKIIQDFRVFLLTKGGGGRRNTPTKGDISNFRSLLKGIGWENFGDPNILNQYVSSATCSASTIYCRLRVYERFVHFLRVQLPSLLPSSERLRTVESMLSNLKEALGKDRHLRTKDTMAASRERMPLSFDVLREWRLKRHYVKVKDSFKVVTANPSCINEALFLKLRNFLIVEIILANAQRSGIIEGMLIREVLKANESSNHDNLHHIYITNHKTGYIQPAIIYLEPEIFNGITVSSIKTYYISCV